QDACPTTELFVGNAGTAARFLSAFVCLGNGVYRLSGVPRMHERPQAALFQALRELGYRVESEKGNDRLPVKIFNDGKRNFQFLKKVISSGKKSCRVSIEESSQFASALLLCAKAGGWKIEAVGENAEESPYVAMTSKLIEAFPKNGGKFQIEPDASSGSYFWAVDVLEPFYQGKTIEDIKPENKMNWPITIANWPNSTWQIDTKFPDSIAMFNGSNLYVTTLVASQRGPNWREQIYAEQFPILNPSHLERSNTPIPSGEFEANVNLITRSRKSDLGDSIMTLVVMASTCFAKIDFFDLGRLRLQETERVVALRTELTKCGAKVVEEGDTLTVYPSQLHGAEIETYNDHRMAMCFAILGLEVPGIKIINPACVKKTFPNFFQKLAAPPPHGLGATILDAKTGRKLSHEELFAD
ncbi:MAG: 3-phosphoshikimate 1-carboxyvinyltransferase, partial [Limisphaerales bacterium]